VSTKKKRQKKKWIRISPINFYADKLHGELRILDWLFYQICVNAWNSVAVDEKFF
jgi:hypothetical protein